jgi:predicted transcriptional regulator
MSATIHHMPPVGCIRLPRELRRALNQVAHRQPGRRAMLERQAVRLWLEHGPDHALQWIRWG